MTLHVPGNGKSISKQPMQRRGISQPNECSGENKGFGTTPIRVPDPSIYELGDLRRCTQPLTVPHLYSEDGSSPEASVQPYPGSTCPAGRLVLHTREGKVLVAVIRVGLLFAVQEERSLQTSFVTHLVGRGAANRRMAEKAKMTEQPNCVINSLKNLCSVGFPNSEILSPSPLRK